MTCSEELYGLMLPQCGQREQLIWQTETCIESQGLLNLSWSAHFQAKNSRIKQAVAGNLTMSQ